MRKLNLGVPSDQTVNGKLTWVLKALKTIDDYSRVAFNLFTTTQAGTVPPSGGGTTNFLRADGTWAAPPAQAWFAGGVVTLAVAPATTTVVTVAGVTSSKRVHLYPQTLDAANNVATTFAATGSGSFTITHVSSALSDRTFYWDIFG